MRCNVSEKFKFQIKTSADTTVVELIGQIDEDASFEELKALKGDHFTFDFEQMSLINSCGIREWISFIEKIPSNTGMTYLNCPQIVIEQMNMVHGFIKEGAVIESFYAPYYCESCDHEQKIKLLTKDIKNRQAPTTKCPKCESEMEFDAIPEQYFRFISK